MQERSIRFPADLAYVPSLRDFAVATVDDAGSDVDRDALALIVGELAANASQHQDGDAELIVRVHPDGCVDVEVVDESAVIPSAETSPADDLDGHRGLHLVHTMSQSWGVTPEGPGKRVWARLVPPPAT